MRTLRGSAVLAFPDFKQERSFSLQHSHLLCSKQHIDMSERNGTDEVNRLNSFYQRYHDAQKEKIATDQLNLKVSVYRAFSMSPPSVLIPDFYVGVLGSNGQRSISVFSR